MKEAFGELIGIVIGRYILGSIGASTRYVYLKLRGKPVAFKKLWHDENIDPYHNQEFRSGIVGLGMLVLLAVLLLAILGG